MSELISGEDALKYIGSGRTIGFKKDFNSQLCWIDKQDNYLHISDFFNGDFQFFLKPKMIEVNGIEIPEPFKPKYGEKFYRIAPIIECGYTDGTVFSLYTNRV